MFRNLLKLRRITNRNKNMCLKREELMFLPFLIYKMMDVYTNRRYLCKKDI